MEQIIRKTELPTVNRYGFLLLTDFTMMALPPRSNRCVRPTAIPSLSYTNSPCSRLTVPPDVPAMV